MDQIKINGGYTLSGDIQIGGAKNSAVALIPAALLSKGKCVISNVPNITDRDAIFDILKSLNCKVIMRGSVVSIDSSNLKNNVISKELSCRLRASYYFMGVLLALYKHVKIYFPGGCNIGKRPIDLHLSGFEKMGVKVHHDEETHIYNLTADELKGANIKLSFASVGATINLMFAATMAKGTTIIENAAKETEIINIADFLNAMGAKISGAGTEKITIEGVKSMHEADIKVIPDRIEAGTYLMLGAMIGRDLTVCGVNPEHIRSLLDKFDDMGIPYKINGDKINIKRVKSFKACDVRTDVYPGFPTDLGQPMSVLLTQGKGISNIEETIWENRMQHVEYLNKMGAGISLNDLTHAQIKGPVKLRGKSINATDLRGGVALVMAGLIADGTTRISNIEYILRGYENLIKKLQNVGADIQIIETE